MIFQSLLIVFLSLRLRGVTATPLQSSQDANGFKVYQIAAITDLDRTSKLDGKFEWKAILRHGTLLVNEKTLHVTVIWSRNTSDSKDVVTGYSYKGRGAELSELTTFDGHLLTADDRTGIVFRLEQDQAVPWVILADGDGNKTNGFKCEWATAKDGKLYVGSHGNEWLSKTKKILREKQFVKVISPEGHVEHLDWSGKYDKLRKAYGTKYPGYLTHEAVEWSEKLKRWVFLPRKCSREAYEAEADEKRACNIILTADSSFSRIDVVSIKGTPTPTRGFSSFKFLPNTGDKVIVALKTEEIGDKQASFITVLKLSGEVLLQDKLVSMTEKYEGFEFL